MKRCCLIAIILCSLVALVQAETIRISGNNTVHRANGEAATITVRGSHHNLWIEQASMLELTGDHHDG